MIEPLTFTFTAKISTDYFQITTSLQSYYLEQTPVTYLICYFSDSTVWWHLCFTGICFDWHTISKGNNILFITVLSQLPGCLIPLWSSIYLSGHMCYLALVIIMWFLTWWLSLKRCQLTRGHCALNSQYPHTNSLDWSHTFP